MKKTVQITFFVHGTTLDNERGVATGQAPGELSELGARQSKELGKIVAGKKFDAIFCSDLKRAVDSARLAFKNAPIIEDERLRECDYGDLTEGDTEEVESLLARYNTSFPNGESLKDVEKRVKSFLRDLLKKYAGKRIAIVSHQAPQLALEVVLNGKSWGQAVRGDWRRKKPKEWKPGWNYELVE
jgi:broad specificity phosphatase PhoE